MPQLISTETCMSGAIGPKTQMKQT